MSSYRIVFEGFESASAWEEAQAKLSANGLRTVVQSDSAAPEGFNLSPEVASIVVSGVGALSSAISALLVFLANRKRGKIIIIGQSGRKIEVPHDTPPERLANYIESAKELDEVRQITVYSR